MEDISDVVRKYDELGPDEFTRFEEEGVRGDLAYRMELEVLLERTSAGDVVLDVGGGNGKFAIPLAERGRRVHLVDVSTRQVRFARKRASDAGVADDLSVHHGDLRALQFDDDTFDAIVCLGGPLSHVKGDVDRGLAEFGRVARPGATVVTSVISRSAHINDLYHTLAETGPEDLPAAFDALAEVKTEASGHYEDIGTFRKYSAEEFRTELERCGFEVELTQAIDRYPPVMEFPMRKAYDHEESREALYEYERRVSRLPWNHDTGNIVLTVSRVPPATD